MPTPNNDDLPAFRDWIWHRHASLFLCEQLCGDVAHAISRLLLRLMLDRRFQSITYPRMTVRSRVARLPRQFELSDGLVGLRRSPCTGKKESLTMTCIATLRTQAVVMVVVSDHAQLIRCLELGDRGATLELHYSL
jgi:hypothetical protein